MENGKELVVEQISIPSFRQFCAINESVDAEMTLYSEIASRVDQLKDVYGEKAISKTGLIKALMSLNELILTGAKENQSQAASQPQPAQPQPIQPQPAQSQPIQPQPAQSQPIQPQATQPQITQPQTQSQTEKK